MSNNQTEIHITAVGVENTEEPYVSDVYWNEVDFNIDHIHNLDYFRDSNTHHVIQAIDLQNLRNRMDEIARENCERKQDWKNAWETLCQELENLRKEVEQE